MACRARFYYREVRAACARVARNWGASCRVLGCENAKAATRRPGSPAPSARNRPARPRRSESSRGRSRSSTCARKRRAPTRRGRRHGPACTRGRLAARRRTGRGSGPRRRRRTGRTCGAWGGRAAGCPWWAPDRQPAGSAARPAARRARRCRREPIGATTARRSWAWRDGRGLGAFGLRAPLRDGHTVLLPWPSPHMGARK